MTTTLQIERRLSALNGASFQRLCDAYLRQRGIESYLSIGLALGRDKTRVGTPDSLVGEATGHTFVEATTQADGLAAKLVDDLGKCLDPGRTGVPVDRILRIVLFFTGYLDPTEVESLCAVVRPHGISLTLIGPHELADDLRYRFASLAHEYLGLPIDTGQVLDPDTFVRRQEVSAVQTDLDAQFVGREAELTAMAAHLGDAAGRPVVLLTGSSGVGKTRLALEAARRARQASSPATILCVRSRGVDPTADLRAALERPGRYLVLFDDANRLANLAGVLDIALEPQAGRNVRVLLTVRDYVAEDIHALLRERGEPEVVAVGPLGDDMLRKILSGTFAIRHHQYQQRILEISAGNARLAVMAARVALATNDLSQLHDATDVYQQFFGPLQRECPLVRTREGLRALGAVALVGQLDVTQPELASAVARLHGLDATSFHATIEALDELELVDLYENEIVRVADQTLAAYVLYLALVDRRELSLVDALLELYPRAPGALIEALGGVVSAFRSAKVAAEFESAVNAVWDRAPSRVAGGAVRGFCVHLRRHPPGRSTGSGLSTRLETAPAEPVPDAGKRRVVISVQDSVHDSPTLLLGRFRNDPGLRTVALRAIVAEARRQRARIPVLLRLAWERYGFTPETDWIGLEPERALMDVLWQEAGEDRETAAPMFIALAGRALQTEHDSVAPRRRDSITFARFGVPATVQVRAFRDELWRRLSALLAVPELRPVVLDAVTTYAQGGRPQQDRAMVAGDLLTLEPLLLPTLDPDSCEDLALLRRLRQLRERLGLGIPPAYAPFLGTPHARMAALLLRDPTEDADLGWRAAAAKHRARMQRLGEQAEAERLAGFASELASLLAVHTDHEAYRIREAATTMLVGAAATNADAVVDVVRGWIATGNPLEFPPAPLVNALMRAKGAEATWSLVATAATSPARDPWIAAWLQLLPPDAWTVEHAGLAAELLLGAALREFWRARDLLDRVCAVDPEKGSYLLGALVGRVRVDPALARPLGLDFHDGAVLGTPLGTVLCQNPELFSAFYLVLDASERHLDAHAAVLDALVSINPGFATRWLDQVLSQTRRPSGGEDREYSVLWRRDDWAAVLGPMARQIIEDDRGTRLVGSMLGTLLRVPEAAPDTMMISTRQDELLANLIGETRYDPERRRRLFYAFSDLPAARRHGLICAYLNLEPAVEDFASLTLEPTDWTWSGSEIPLLEQRRAFFASLLSACDRPTLLPHRALLEERLRSFDGEIANARRTDFREQRSRA